MLIHNRSNGESTNHIDRNPYYRWKEETRIQFIESVEEYGGIEGKRIQAKSDLKNL